MLKIRRRPAVEGDGFSRAGMDELKVRGMEGNAIYERLRRFGPMVFPVAYEGVADRRELRPDLILQSGYQFNADERCVGKNALDGISKLRSRRFRVTGAAQLLKHSFTPEMVDESPRFRGEAAAYDREILSCRSMAEKIAHQGVSVVTGLGKQQNSRGKTIDAVHDPGSLFLRLECRDKHGESRRDL